VGRKAMLDAAQAAADVAMHRPVCAQSDSPVPVPVPVPLPVPVVVLLLLRS